MLHLYQDTPIGGGDALYAMADVNINNPEDGQMLVYDASTQRWRNVTQKSLNDLAEVTDLTNVIATGSTNATGATIPKGLYFYLNDELCQAKVDIANGATFTLNTNYAVVTAGGLNSLNSALTDVEETVTANELGTYVNISSYTSDWYICPSDGYIHIRCNTTGTTMQAQITGPTGGVDLYLKAIGASGGVFDSISVKKGMKVKMIKTGSGDAYGYFVPLE